MRRFHGEREVSAREENFTGKDGRFGGMEKSTQDAREKLLVAGTELFATVFFELVDNFCAIHSTFI